MSAVVPGAPLLSLRGVRKSFGAGEGRKVVAALIVEPPA